MSPLLKKVTFMIAMIKNQEWVLETGYFSSFYYTLVGKVILTLLFFIGLDFPWKYLIWDPLKDLS